MNILNNVLVVKHFEYHSRLNDKQMKVLLYIFVQFLYHIEGQQSVPPQNMPLWDIILSWLFLRNEGKTLALPSNCIQEFRQRTCSGKGMSSQITSLIPTSVCQGGRQQGPFDQRPLCASLLKMPQQTFIYQTFAFPSPYELPFCPLKPQTSPPPPFLLSSN